MVIQAESFKMLFSNRQAAVEHCTNAASYIITILLTLMQSQMLPEKWYGKSI